MYSEKTIEKVAELRLIDDTLFRVVAARKEVCQEILRTLLDEPELTVISVTPQERITSLHREVWLDVLCRLEDGRYINVEVQKGNKNDDVRRTRFHLSSITTAHTPKGTDFSDIPDVTVIYISDYDALESGQTITACEMCACIGGTYRPVGDGARIYYANTVVDDGSDKSELLGLFLKKEAFDNKKFPNLSNAMNYYKNTGKGSGEMCDIVEEYAKEYAREHAKEYAKEYANGKVKSAMQNIAVSLFSENWSDEKISEKTGLSVEEIAKLRASEE